MAGRGASRWQHHRPRWALMPLALILALTLALPVVAGAAPASAAGTGAYLGHLADNGVTSTYVVVRPDGTPYWSSPSYDVIDGAIGHVTSAGPTIAYVEESETAASYIDRLHVLNQTHGDEIVYSAPPGVDVREPVVSPDGSTILFVLDGDTSTLAAVDANTRNAHAVRTSTSTLYAGPSFSPDGRWISWVQELPTNPPTHQIASAPLAGGPGSFVAQAQSEALAYVDTAWSPDGRTLLAVRLEQAYGTQEPVSSIERFDLRAGSSRVVLRGGVSGAAVTSYGEPSWSPDGTASFATKVVQTGSDVALSLVRLPDEPSASPEPVATTDYAGAVSAAGPPLAADDLAPSAVTAAAGSLVTASRARVTFGLPADADLADVVVTRAAGGPADTPTATTEVGRTRSTSFDVPLPAPATYYAISLLARDWSGNLSPASKVFVRSPDASSVSVSTPPSKLAYRTAVRFTGRVDSVGKPVTGRVTLYARRANTTTAVGVASATLAADGSYVLGHTPPWTAEYQVRFAGSPTGWAADSAKRVVLVVPLVSLDASASRTTLGRTVNLAGGVSPAHAGQVVDVQRYVGRGAWRTIASSRLSSTSRYRCPLKAGSRGTWILRVVKRADGDHLLAVSPSRTLYVD